MFFSGGPRLRSTDIVQDVLEVLRDEFMCKVFGVGHTNILLKDILCVRKYWAELNSKMWHGKYWAELNSKMWHGNYWAELNSKMWHGKYWAELKLKIQYV